MLTNISVKTKNSKSKTLKRCNRFINGCLRVLICLILIDKAFSSETSSMLEGAICLSSYAWWPGYPGDNLVDSQGFFKMTHTYEMTNPALTYKLTSVRTVKTVFVLSREGCCGARIRMS